MTIPRPIALLWVLLAVFLVACSTADPTPTPLPPTAQPDPTVTPEPEVEAEEEMTESMPTIADIAVGSEDFETLVAALSAAGLVDTFADADGGPFTVFAPTDDAFAALPAGTLDVLLADPSGALTTVLTYHVVEGAVLAETVVTLDSATTLGGEDVTIEVVDGGVVLNGSVNVTATDIEASNGVIHVLDAVLIPPSMTAAEEPMDDEMDETMEEPGTIAEVASAAGSFGTLLTALEAAGLAGTFADAEAGPFTVFAPTDDAFAALPEGTVAALLEDPTGALTDILTYHVVEGEVLAETVVTLDSAVTLNGAAVSIAVIDGGVVLNDSVNVIQTDIQTSNGVIHVIDAVLLPPAEAAVGDGSENVGTGRVFAIPGDSVFPEGVSYNPTNGKFYVGATSDGTLYEGDVNGSAEMSVFSPGGADGRVAAIGTKVDDAGNLWVAGGATGQMFAYDTSDASLIAAWTTPASDGTFINDLAITESGVYFTDSFRPILWRISDLSGGEAEAWLDFSGTAINYGNGFNLNGIIATADGNDLIVVHSGEGVLYRINIATKQVMAIDTGAAELTAGDGLDRIDNTIYVTRNAFGEIVPVELAADLGSGAAGEAITSELFGYPTTIAYTGNTFLVANSQFNNQGGTPNLPFTVAQVPVMAAAADEMMTEPTMTIAEIAIADGRFNTLVAALTAAGLADTFADANAGPFTVFAPVDAAFDALPEGTLDTLLADPTGALTQILQYHVVDGAVKAETVVTLDSAMTLLGETVSIAVTDGGVVLNGTVNVIITDIEATNGVIHVIDTVLLPPSE